MSYLKTPHASLALSGKRSTFISGDEAMQWLKDVHLPGLSDQYKSACLYGNEDCPEVIQVYEDEDPSIYDEPTTYVRREEEE